MTAVLAVLLFVVRAVLVILGVVVLLAVLALICPFCADLDWEGDPDEDSLGTLRVRAGALGFTLPVWQYPPPPPPPPGAEPAKPGPVKRLLAKLKARFAAWRQKRAARRPPKKPAPARPRQRAKLTLNTLCALLRGGKKLTLAVFDALRITRIQVVWPVGNGLEPDEAARAYGAAHAWLYSALGVLNRFVYLDFRELRLVPCIQPDTPVPAARVSFRVSARALFVLIAAVQVLIAFHREKVLDVFL